MNDGIRITGTIRDFTRQLYAETVSTIEALFEENTHDTSLTITGIRVCCGSEAVNKNEDGTYMLPDNTPWLAELTFGLNGSDAAVDNSRMSFREISNQRIASWPCTALQGIGRVWARGLASANIRSVAQLASLSHDELLLLQARLKTRKVFEFHRKARLAMQPCPQVPFSSFDKLTPFAFLELQKDAALETAPALTANDWEKVATFLGILVAVITDSYLERTTLGELFFRPMA